MDVGGAGIAAGLAAGLLYAVPGGDPERGAEPIGVCLRRPALPGVGKFMRNSRDPRPGDYRIPPPLGGVHPAPISEVRAAVPERDHIVGTAGVVAATHGVQHRALGGAPSAAADATDLVVRRRHGAI